ncbi:hypothetical protein [Nonomuraea wenchangensis]|uniref:hypothetical protein n=1 Tax=Nonomuraea wenchangensis TaxID=568860 RepID=UPI0015A6A1C1
MSFVVTCECQPTHTVRTDITPPPGSWVRRIGTGPVAHSRQARTRWRCSSIDNQPGTWTAPGAISLNGSGNIVTQPTTRL